MASQITNDDLTLSVLKPELGVPVTYRPIKPVLPKPAPAPLTLATITPITNPKTSAGTTAKSAPKGTPVQLWNLAVTTEPYKVNNTMYIIVSVTFSFDAGDPNYGGADIWFAGYHGNTVPALVASGQSEPLSFLVDATGEYIVVTAVAVSPGGVRAPFSGSPQVAITLSPVSAQPPAPTVAQTLIALPGGFYQFGFSYLSGILSTIIAGYNIYQNTSNTFSGATKIKTVPQDPTATGSYYFQISIGTLAASTYYYFVTAVDVFGNESAATSAQSGAVVTSTTLDSVPDGTLYSKTNPQMTQAGVCPVSAATAISNSLTSGGALSQWVQGNSITVELDDAG